MLISGVTLGAFHHDHPAPAKHDHVILDMEGGARVTFNDARRFGAMDLMATAVITSYSIHYTKLYEAHIFLRSAVKKRLMAQVQDVFGIARGRTDVV